MKKLFFLFIIFQNCLLAQNILLHSHNDYLQKYPLQTALENKANTIEVDVAWFKNEMRVSHLNFALSGKPFLEELYLKPMLAKKESLPSVQFLMIDIKSGGMEILEALNTMISEYQEIFASRTETNSNKIKVVISGAANRQSLIKNEKLNYLFADGNPADLNANLESNLMPFVSTNFKSMNQTEKLAFIQNAHQQNKLVRFWNTRNTKKSWQKLIELNVDIIGVDKLKKFSDFLR